MLGVHEGSEHRRGIHGVAHDDRGHGGHETINELVRSVLDDDEALRRDATLPVVLDPSGHRLRDRELHVGRAGDDEGVGSAELEHALLEVGAGEPAHPLAGALRTRERHGCDSVIGDHRRQRVVREEEVGEDTHGEAGPQEEVLEELPRARNVVRVLQDAHVAGHETGGDEANRLPERVVPGHDGEHRPERLVADTARGRGRGDRLLAQERLGVLGEVPHRRRALEDFRLGRRERLSHL